MNIIEKRYPYIDDLYNLKEIESIDFNKEKSLLTYDINFGQKSNKYYNKEVILLDLQKNTRKKISSGGTIEYSPKFSYNGEYLAFISNATGENQIYIYDLEKDQVKQITTMRFGVSNFKFSPIENKIIFTSDYELDFNKELLQVEIDQQERIKQENLKFKKPFIIKELGCRDEKHGERAYYKKHNVYEMDINTLEIALIIDGIYSPCNINYSHDGKYIGFISDKENRNFYDAYVYSIKDKSIEKVTSNVNIKSELIFNEGNIFFVAQGVARVKPALSNLYKLDTNTKEKVNLTEKIFDYGIGYSIASNKDYEREGKYRIQLFNNQIYFLSGVKGCVNLYSLDIDNPTNINSIINKNQVIEDFVVTDNNILYSCSNYFTPLEIYSFNIDTKNSIKISEENKFFENIIFNEIVEVFVPTIDKTVILQGWVIKPSNFVDGKKYDAILQVHGGPDKFYGNKFDLEMQCMASEGVAVLIVNPRGSSSYGQEFLNEDYAYDQSAYYDLLTFVDEVTNKFNWIDKNNISICGLGYGGYLSTWAVAHSNIFKTAITMGATTNNLIAYASSDINTGNSRELYNDFVDFGLNMLKSSPVAYADKINIPFLILHGEQDLHSDVANAHQLFTAIKDYHPKLPVRMILFPNSG
ncbi:MAG: S9 family peptidase, partial [Intestinibacter sp.]|uniref:S9 family peptidase n=1 Tax=Intestinibacter sp. TaxID=1965304 RepID=UPI003F14CDBD